MPSVCREYRRRAHGGTPGRHHPAFGATGGPYTPSRGANPSVRLREAEGLLRDEVEDHLVAHRRDAQQPHETPEIGEAVLRGHAVAAVGLDGSVEAVRARLG